MTQSHNGKRTLPLDDELVSALTELRKPQTRDSQGRGQRLTGRARPARLVHRGFAMTQLEAAVERPEHVRAIFPVAVTTDRYEAAMHHGLFSSGFVTPFLAMVGMTSGRSDRFWRSTLDASRDVRWTPVLHRKFATMNGESSVTMLHELLRLHHGPHPWDDLWRAMAVEHPLRDDWWDERDLQPLLGNVGVPTYLGCDWQNVPLHLPSTFRALAALTSAPVVRVGMLGEFGLTWPWESLHLEALPWYDHWLKG